MQSIADFLCSFAPQEVKHLHTGDILFERNQTATAIYVVQQGKVKLLRNTIDGHTVVLHIAMAGECLAEAALFASHYHCQAVADTPCEINCFAKTAILDSLAKTPAMALKFIELLSRQVQSLRQLIELRNIRSPRERIVQYLQSIADGNRVITITSSYKDLAYRLGMSHETLYRKITELEQQNVIEKNNKTIYLKI
jgi:CRP-like cAMP-binding protein